MGDDAQSQLTTTLRLTLLKEHNRTMFVVMMFVLLDVVLLL
jgi:hypothetical protein